MLTPIPIREPALRALTLVGCAVEVAARKNAVEFEIDAGGAVGDVDDNAMEERYVCRGSDIVVDGFGDVVINVDKIVTGGQRAPGHGRWMDESVLVRWLAELARDDMLLIVA